MGKARTVPFMDAAGRGLPNFGLMRLNPALNLAIW